MSQPGFEYLPHPADVRFRATGTALEETFEQAATAMFNVMIMGMDEIRPERSVAIRLEASTLDDLLYDYLSELLYLFEVEELIFGHFNVDSIQQTDSGYLLEGQARGEDLDPDKHRFDTEVKAVTYHQLAVKKEAAGYSAHVIVDT